MERKKRDKKARIDNANYPFSLVTHVFLDTPAREYEGTLLTHGIHEKQLLILRLFLYLLISKVLVIID